MIVNPKDLSNGWYGLPPVSVEMLQPVLAVLVANGAPIGRLDTPTMAKWGNEVQKAPPTVIVFEKNGITKEHDAVYTYYGPQIAWVEICEEFGIPYKPLRFPDPPNVAVVKNPIGPMIDAARNYYSSTGGNDRFKDGAVYSDSTGTYVKHEGFLSLFTRAWWEKIS